MEFINKGEPQKKQSRMDVSVKEKKDMECYICLDIPETSPVYKCVNEHILCNKCRPSITSEKCLICNVELGMDRCSTTEMYIANRTNKCNDTLEDYQFCLRLQQDQDNELECIEKKKKQEVWLGRNTSPTYSPTAQRKIEWEIKAKIEQEEADFEFAKSLERELSRSVDSYTAANHNLSLTAAKKESESEDSSSGDEEIEESDWYSPDNEVIIRDSHEDSGLCGQIGVVRGVTPGMCSVFLNEEERTINIAAEHLQPVTPVRGDKIKVIMGEDRESTGYLLSIDGREGVVKLDQSGDVKLLQLRFLCKTRKAKGE